MNLTKEQSAVVNDWKNRVVSSCPGSGKTRTIIAKILFCLETVRNTPRKIGCITYTNTAANEIVARLHESGSTGDDDYYEVNTIHSFCLNNIVRPYGHLIPELQHDIEILSPDSLWFQETVSTLIAKYDLPSRLADSFAEIQRTPTGDLIVPEGLPSQVAKEFVADLRANNLLTFSDIVYYAYKIIKLHPFVARALSARFAWLLVDEFQDTNELQVQLLTAVHSQGHTKFFLVGDPNQSIYAFAGARPDLMTEIVNRIEAADDISLSGNFRSSEPIIAVAERLCPRTPSMTAEGPAKAFPVAPGHYQVASPSEAILGYFLPEAERHGIKYGDMAILAPWWTGLFPLARQLRLRGIPVLGPGARPYRRSLDFAQFSEAAAAYVVSRDADSATAAQRALFFLLLRLNDGPTWQVFSYGGKRTLCALLGAAQSLYEMNIGAIEWLKQFAIRSSELLIQDGLIDAVGKDLVLQSVDAMIDSIRRVDKDCDNMAVEDLGIFARPGECIGLMTLHASKGKEFDAVAVIDFHEGRVPHFTVQNYDLERLAEARRLTYVAATRARKLLMFFTDTLDRRNRPSRFLGQDGMALSRS